MVQGTNVTSPKDEATAAPILSRTRIILFIFVIAFLTNAITFLTNAITFLTNAITFLTNAITFLTNAITFLTNAIAITKVMLGKWTILGRLSRSAEHLFITSLIKPKGL